VSEFKVLRSPDDWEGLYCRHVPSVVSIGNFDGLHLGHRKILQQVVERARATSTVAAVVIRIGRSRVPAASMTAESLSLPSS
jgi:FAD synthase